MADFVDNLALVNGLAERSDGFVWRYQDDSGSAIDTRPFDGDPRMAINLSVWDRRRRARALCLADRAQAILRAAGRMVREDGRALFRDVVGAGGHRPTVQEAIERLEHLKRMAERSRLRLGSCRRRSVKTRVRMSAEIDGDEPDNLFCDLRTRTQESTARSD